MTILEIILSFISGVLLLVILGWIFSFKTKGIIRLLVNTAIGAVVLVLLNVFNIATLAVNPLNALIVGFFGIFGVVGIWLITVFL
ncbi:MAG: pro-sigmaK processing inhibitor BofA family protein [Firmicutes bacterium]|nr:pro-sigmaK processing inhibitor BofA family protein [Bacillota bacterium]